MPPSTTNTTSTKPSSSGVYAGASPAPAGTPGLPFFLLFLGSSRSSSSGVRTATLWIGTAEGDASVADVDEYTLDLTGRIGNRIDVVLDGQAGVDFSTATVELLDTDGVTVLATSASAPLGVAAANYDTALLGFTVPADGVYTLRVESLVSGEYGMVVTDSLLFDSEPNATSVDPLRSLDNDAAVLGFLEGYGAPLLFAMEYSCRHDPRRFTPSIR